MTVVLFINDDCTQNNLERGYDFHSWIYNLMKTVDSQ